MYCIECGAQIPDNSKFCSHCGKRQDEGQSSSKEQLAEHIIESEKTRQVIEEHRKSLDYHSLKKTMGWYIAWVLLHLGLLLISSRGIFKGNNMGANKFWPFSSYDDVRLRHSYELYDITEFLVYTIFPLVILIIWSMVRSQSKNNV
ncbi:MAG: zinc-ribbon domain-containing protein [Bacteroidales bacterium]|jgi:hypothetical protein|nr:zinc-ribbon domain-containing protein [Bacteroidales bacterium]